VRLLISDQVINISVLESLMTIWWPFSLRTSKYHLMLRHIFFAVAADASGVLMPDGQARSCT